MALKITELTELAATPDNADILVIVDDVAGSPITKKITAANLRAGLVTAAANLAAEALVVGDDGAKGVKALALGAANLKLFVNAAGTANEYASGIYLLESTRDLAAATGDVAYTGVGHVPSRVIALLVPPSGGTTVISVGFGSSSSAMGFCTNAGTAGTFVPLSDFGPDTIVCGYPDVGAYNRAVIKSMDADGFTLTWEKVGSPTGLYAFIVLCFR